MHKYNYAESNSNLPEKNESALLEYMPAGLHIHIFIYTYVLTLQPPRVCTLCSYNCVEAHGCDVCYAAQDWTLLLSAWETQSA